MFDIISSISDPNDEINNPDLSGVSHKFTLNALLNNILDTGSVNTLYDIVSSCTSGVV